MVVRQRGEGGREGNAKKKEKREKGKKRGISTVAKRRERGTRPFFDRPKQAGKKKSRTHKKKKKISHEKGEKIVHLWREKTEGKGLKVEKPENPGKEGREKKRGRQKKKGTVGGGGGNPVHPSSWGRW